MITDDWHLSGQNAALILLDENDRFRQRASYRTQRRHYQTYEGQHLAKRARNVHVNEGDLIVPS